MLDIVWRRRCCSAPGGGSHARWREVPAAAFRACLTGFGRVGPLIRFVVDRMKQHSSGAANNVAGIDASRGTSVMGGGAMLAALRHVALLLWASNAGTMVIETAKPLRLRWCGGRVCRRTGWQPALTGCIIQAFQASCAASGSPMMLPASSTGKLPPSCLDSLPFPTPLLPLCVLGLAMPRHLTPPHATFRAGLQPGAAHPPGVCHPHDPIQHLHLRWRSAAAPASTAAHTRLVSGPGCAPGADAAAHCHAAGWRICRCVGGRVCSAAHLPAGQ